MKSLHAIKTTPVLTKRHKALVAMARDAGYTEVRIRVTDKGTVKVDAKYQDYEWYVFDRYIWNDDLDRLARKYKESMHTWTTGLIRDKGNR